MAEPPNEPTDLKTVDTSFMYHAGHTIASMRSGDQSASTVHVHI
jgi:hypothetical protein